eukprot:6231936-Amphidinium_carterae.1
MQFASAMLQGIVPWDVLRQQLTLPSETSMGTDRYGWEFSLKNDNSLGSGWGGTPFGVVGSPQEVDWPVARVKQFC